MFIKFTVNGFRDLKEMFKKITGLPGIATQPVAGAQGELVGLVALLERIPRHVDRDY
mgnify:CR=1 FL=1